MSFWTGFEKRAKSIDDVWDERDDADTLQDKILALTRNKSVIEKHYRDELHQEMKGIGSLPIPRKPILPGYKMPLLAGGGLGAGIGAIIGGINRGPVGALAGGGLGALGGAGIGALTNASIRGATSFSHESEKNNIISAKQYLKKSPTERRNYLNEAAERMFENNVDDVVEEHNEEQRQQWEDERKEEDEREKRRNTYYSGY